MGINRRLTNTYAARVEHGICHRGAMPVVPSSSMPFTLSGLTSVSSSSRLAEYGFLVGAIQRRPRQLGQALNPPVRRADPSIGSDDLIARSLPPATAVVHDF